MRRDLYMSPEAFRKKIASKSKQSSYLDMVYYEANPGNPEHDDNFPLQQDIIITSCLSCGRIGCTDCGGNYN